MSKRKAAEQKDPSSNQDTEMHIDNRKEEDEDDEDEDEDEDDLEVCGPPSPPPNTLELTHQLH